MALGTEDDLIGALARADVVPLWDRYHRIMPHTPTSPDRPMLWRWRDMLGLIERAVAEVGMPAAERRVLMLVNPAFGERAVTTTNLFAGLQILAGGERAPPHRHTPSAMRFVIEGGDAVTVVEGRECPMQAGDLILTPNWTWHEHANHGSQRVVWLDALDGPLANALGGTVFAEGGADAAAAPIARGDPQQSPTFRYPWEQTLAALARLRADADGAKRLRYSDPVRGAPVILTLDSYAWELRRGIETRPARSSANAVVLVVAGEGVSHVGEETLNWRAHDVFTLPYWRWASHKATSETAHLFMFTDHEVLKRLDLLREETAESPAERPS